MGGRHWMSGSSKWMDCPFDFFLFCDWFAMFDSIQQFPWFHSAPVSIGGLVHLHWDGIENRLRLGFPLTTRGNFHISWVEESKYVLCWETSCYRWVPLDPNTDKSKSQFIQSLLEIICCVFRMLNSMLNWRNLPKPKDFRLVLFVWIKQDPPVLPRHEACRWEGS